LATPPTGRVVFLFTDIEGSTRRWEQYPDLMKVALARHDQILRAAIESHRGYVFKTIGDAFCAAFPEPAVALAATLAAQRSIEGETWDVPGGIHVRMALHAGETVEREGDYFGPPVNRVARLLSAGHGGQTLLSAAMEELVRANLPAGVTLRDMGERRLKDLGQPERIFQVDAPELPASFPPLKTLDARPNNIPLQPNLLVGREAEVGQAQKLLLRPGVRILTFSGPGGTGKTRLALQVAADMIDVFDDGAYFVPLADVRDPDLFASTVAHAMNMREEGARPVVEQLKELIGGKRILLVLDNFEQVLPAAPVVSDLLSACPQLEILVTSRAVLRLSGEHEFPVPPLGLPRMRHLPPVEVLLRDFPAVALFVQRAAAVKPDFALTEENKQTVAEICTRLDGLPLGIELAASRIKLLPPQMMLTKLESALKLLTGGARDLPARQQTLRGAIAWSYDLMEPGERTLWQRLSVFQGGCSFEAAEAVCNADGTLDVLDGLGSLADQSLLRQGEQEELHGEPRFTMLLTLREFAAERLQESGEEGEIRSQHAAFFRRMAQASEPELTGPRQDALLDHLAAEHDNLRGALDWLVRENPEAALEMAGSLWRFWELRSHFGEARERLDEVLDLAPEASSNRAKALRGAGIIAYNLGDYPTARRRALESQEIWRAGGDHAGVADSYTDLGIIETDVGDYVKARAHHEMALGLRTDMKDHRGVARSSSNLGQIAERLGEFETARSYYEQSLSTRRKAQDRSGVATALMNLGNLARRQGDYSTARERYDESLAIRRGLGHVQGMASALNALGLVEMFQGSFEESKRHFLEARDLLRDLGARADEAAVLGNLGEVTEQLGDVEHARACLEESLSIERGLGNARHVAYALGTLGRLNTRLRYFGTARQYLTECLRTLKDVGEPDAIAQTLETWARLEASEGSGERALTLAAAAAALRRQVGAPAPEALQQELDRELEAVREEMVSAEIERAELRGQGLSQHDAIAYALGDG